METDELAQAWVKDLGASATSEALGLARERIHACGRLASLRAFTHVRAIVRVEVDEHADGKHPHMAEGTAHARVWVRCSSDLECQRIAVELHRLVEQHAWAHQQLLTMGVYRASRWDRLRAWVSWRLAR